MKAPSYKRTVFATYSSTVTQAVTVNLAPILFLIFQNSYGLSDEQVGRLILLNFGTQIVADILATRFADRIGYRVSIIAADVLSVAGLLSMSFFPVWFASPYAGLTGSVLLYAFGGGFIEVLLSAIMEGLPGDEKAGAMSLLHSFYCWGQAFTVLVSTLVLRALGTGIWRWLPVCWSVVPVISIVLFAKAPILPPAPEGEGMSIGRLLRSRFIPVALLMMMCAGSSELTMSQWSSLFAEKGLHVAKWMGDLLGPFLFAVTMGIGRAAYGVFGSRIDLRKCLIALSGMCVCCYLLAVFGSGLFSLLGCALCGFSVSLMWPGTISGTAALYPLGGTAMFGLLAIFGDVGGSVGPWLAGFVSDRLQSGGALLSRLMASTGLDSAQLGLKAGLLAGMIFPMMLCLCAIRMPHPGENGKS